MNPQNRQFGRWSLLRVVLVAGLLTQVGGLDVRAESVQLALNDQIAVSVTFASSDDDSAAIDALVVGGWSRDLLAQVDESSGWAELLQVHVDLPDGGDVPALLGAYSLIGDGDNIQFVPRFGWTPGMSYRVTLRPTADSGRRALVASFYAPLPTAPTEPVTVESIFPSDDVIPENLLRFYVEFSHPMRRGDVYEHIELVDSRGIPVEFPFLQIGQEFWDRDMRRLTVILDPGRVKEGVASNVQAGRPLIEGSHYELVIGGGLRDEHDRPLGQSTRKAFRVIAADDRSPDPEQWTVSSPRAGSRDPILVRLDGAIDPVVARRLIRLERGSGYPTSATISLTERERTIVVTPSTPWTDSEYRLSVLPTLEDYAGNRIESLFDMAPGTVAELEGSTRDPIYIPVVIER